MKKFKKMQKEVKLLLAGARVCAIIAKKMQKSKRLKTPLSPILSGFTRLTLHYFRTIIWCLKKEKGVKRPCDYPLSPFLKPWYFLDTTLFSFRISLVDHCLLSPYSLRGSFPTI